MPRPVRLVLLAALVLLVCAGDSIGRVGRERAPGLQRDVLIALGHPAGWVATHLPFAAASDDVASWFDGSDDDGGAEPLVAASGSSRIDPRAFSAADLDARPVRRALRSLLVTGDSMSQPLDALLARRLVGRGVAVTRDPHLGSGISKPFVVDWPTLARRQARDPAADAVVVFLGANEGFALDGPHGTLQCCTAGWAAEYATRARAMVEAWRRGGAAVVYWVLIPAPRDPDRAAVARTVNAAVRVATAGFGAQVRTVDAPAIFTPGFRFRSSQPVDGRDTVVRRPDGIHLNDAGAAVLADVVQRQLAADVAMGG